MSIVREMVRIVERITDKPNAGPSHADAIYWYWADSLRDLQKAQATIKYIDRHDLDKKISDLVKEIEKSMPERPAKR